ncbi:MAG: hypothetical protein LBV61_11105, partial [Burkholderiaceae bacterium]|nr:hypothetical protein [Burkholderiaceae bacterium]
MNAGLGLRFFAAAGAVTVFSAGVFFAVAMVISFVKREFGEWAVNPRSTKTGALSVTHFFTDTMMLSE